MSIEKRKKRLVLITGNDKPRRDSIGHASGLAVDCWDWPVAYPQTAMSALFLLQHGIGGVISTPVSAARAAGHAQASATSPSVSLIIALDHLLSGVSSHSKGESFSSQEKK